MACTSVSSGRRRPSPPTPAEPELEDAFLYLMNFADAAPPPHDRFLRPHRRHRERGFSDPVPARLDGDRVPVAERVRLCLDSGAVDRAHA